MLCYCCVLYHLKIISTCARSVFGAGAYSFLYLKYELFPLSCFSLLHLLRILVTCQEDCGIHRSWIRTVPDPFSPYPLTKRKNKAIWPRESSKLSLCWYSTRAKNFKRRHDVPIVLSHTSRFKPYQPNIERRKDVPTKYRVLVNSIRYSP